MIKTSRPFVIAIAGPPGGGKTTLSNAISVRLGGAPVLRYDDYQTMTRRGLPEVEDWLSRGAPFDEISAPGFAEELARLLASDASHVIVDGPLGRAYRPTAPMIDFLVFLDTPLDLALSRVIKNATVTAARSPDPDSARRFVGWLETYLDIYQRFSRRAYDLQRRMVMPEAELVLDGESPPDRLADMTLAARERGAGK